MLEKDRNREAAMNTYIARMVDHLLNPSSTSKPKKKELAEEFGENVNTVYSWAMYDKWDDKVKIQMEIIRDGSIESAVEETQLALCELRQEIANVQEERQKAQAATSDAVQMMHRMTDLVNKHLLPHYEEHPEILLDMSPRQQIEFIKVATTAVQGITRAATDIFGSEHNEETIVKGKQMSKELQGQLEKFIQGVGTGAVEVLRNLSDGNNPEKEAEVINMADMIETYQECETDINITTVDEVLGEIDLEEENE